MIPLEEMKKKCFQFLYKLYEMTSGNELELVSIDDIMQELDFTRDQAWQIMAYLKEEQLLKLMNLDGDLQITHSGIVEIEKALSEPEKPTEHFPPDIKNAAQMINSQIQQASPDASQTVSFCDDDYNKLKEMMILLREFIDEDNELESDKKSELIVEIGMIEAQMCSPKPKHNIMVESLHSIRNVIEGAIGSVLTSKFLPMIQKFMASLS